MKEQQQPKVGPGVEKASGLEFERQALASKQTQPAPGCGFRLPSVAEIAVPESKSMSLKKFFLITKSDCFYFRAI